MRWIVENSRKAKPIIDNKNNKNENKYIDSDNKMVYYNNINSKEERRKIVYRNSENY